MHIVHAFLECCLCGALILGADAVADIVDAKCDDAKEEFLDRACMEMSAFYLGKLCGEHSVFALLELFHSFVGDARHPLEEVFLEFSPVADCRAAHCFIPEMLLMMSDSVKTPCYMQGYSIDEQITSYNTPFSAF